MCLTLNDLRECDGNLRGFEIIWKISKKRVVNLNFSDIVNFEKNEKNIKIIKSMVKSGKMPGTFIFEGAPGSGKSETAGVLAKAAVCADTEYKAQYGEPCGVCESCRKAEAGIHPDIMTLESESGAALSLHIDKVREIIDSLYLSPNESDKKIYIIRDMQTMTPQGQNALLKSIEEPPPFVIFIITVTSCDLLLETVKSRAVKFTMETETEMESEHISEAYTGAGKAAENPYGDLIYGILTVFSDDFSTDKLALYQNALSKGIDRLNKTEMLNFYSSLENAVRDIQIAKLFMRGQPVLNGGGAKSDIPFLYFNGADSPQKINKLLNLYSSKKIIGLSRKIHKFKADLDYNINARLNLISFLSEVIQ